DDQVVNVDDSSGLRDRLRRLGKDVTLVTVPRGGHHDLLLSHGIPQGIDWLKQLSHLTPRLPQRPSQTAPTTPSVARVPSPRPPADVPKEPVPARPRSEPPKHAQIQGGIAPSLPGSS